MHLILAFRAFFAALFGKTLPAEVLPAALLPGPMKAPKPIQAPEPAKAPEPVKAPEPKGPPPEAGAVQVLSILQSEGRFLDFLFEDIEGFEDADIGAAVREVHRGCKKALVDHFDLGPVRSEDEDAMITVPDGYDPAELRLVGNVVGRPPFSGTLKHKGWRAGAVRLPKLQTGDAALVITPAEVEV